MQELKFAMIGVIRLLSFFWSSLPYFLVPAKWRYRSAPIFGVYGWYGTETLGDKLILLGLLRACFETHPERRVVVFSTDVEYTVNSLRELCALASSEEFAGYLSGKCVAAPQSQIFQLRRGDSMLLGGGPIMDDPELIKWVCMNFVLKIMGVRRLIVGCGLGPLNLIFARLWTRLLLLLMSDVLIRPSPNRYLKRFSISNVTLCPSFITYFDIKKSSIEERSRKLVFNLREVPPNYLARSDGSAHSFNSSFRDSYLELLSLVIKNFDFKVVSGFSTHERDLTGDSVLCSEMLQRLSAISPALHSARCVTSADDVINEIGDADYAISTRYHGVVLCLILGCKVIGVDYTSGGGKLTALYEYLFKSMKPLQLASMREASFAEAVTDGWVELSTEDVRTIALSTLESVKNVLV